MSAQADKARKVLIKDKRYKRLKNIFENSDLFQIPFDEYKQELKNLHKMRTIHNLSVGHPNFGKELQKAAIRDTTNRHRYSEILFNCTEAHTTLVKMVESFESYFLIKYAYEIKDLYRTKDERKSFIKAVMDKMYRYVDDTEELIKLVKIYIEDIDKAGYTVKNLVDAYAIISKRDYTELG